MQTDPNETTSDPSPARRDAAGWALSAVTLAVLVIGVFVIRGVTERDAEPAASGTAVSTGSQVDSGEVTPVEPPARIEQPIVVHPIATEPTQLPPPDRNADSQSLAPPTPQESRMGALTGDRR
ncbi:hypothetical protein MalM25_10270 [Planctomycetes bacterium MalM25]|nr:hypothetical protein MalM25_10270 [Planctomycetes bacterium MalM25]